MSTELVFPDRMVRLHRPDKVLFAGVGVTKADLAAHFLRAAPRLLPHLRDRPLSLVRMPDGLEGPRFFQKDAGKLPDWRHTCQVEGSSGPSTMPLVESPAELAVLADQAAVELHGWTSTCLRPDRPDRIVFDLDPPTKATFGHARHGARVLCSLLQRHGAAPYVLLTGGRGLHVVVPLRPEATFDEVRAFTDAVGRVLVRHEPDHFTMEARKRRRGQRVYIDTLRNRPKQTAVMPWSPRARPGAPVAVPVAVEALDDPDLDPKMANVLTARAFLERPDPWGDFFDHAVPLRLLI